MSRQDLIALNGDAEPGSVRFDSTSTVVYLDSCEDFEAVCEHGHAKTVSDKTSSIGATRHVRTREAMDADARDGQGGLLIAHLCWPWSPCSAFHEEPQDGEVACFPADYAMLGTRREQVKMAGNAVTPPAARDLISTVAEALS